MNAYSLNFVESLEQRVDDLTSQCVKCGKCFEACPMTGPAGISHHRGADVVAGVLDLLKGATSSSVAASWVSVCTSSGYCIQACDYGVNPRFMVRMARLAYQKASIDEAERRRNGVNAFRNMARIARIVPRLQYEAPEIEEINPGRVDRREPGSPERTETPDVVFYTGCNLLKTPHIAFLCLAVLAALGVRHEVMGGPTACCGVFHWGEGDDAAAGNVAYNTIDKLGQHRTREVITWCPSCQTQLGEIALPSFADERASAPFDLTPFVVYLARRLDDLKAVMTRRVEKRVSLHERPALPAAMQAIKSVLGQIPGLELVDLPVRRIGMMANYLTVVPGLKDELRTEEFRAAAEAGVTTLATVYHACHRDICHYDESTSFEIVNFMELIGESMGIHIPDVYKNLKKMGDVNEVLRAASALMESNNISEVDARASVFADMFAQPRSGVHASE